MGVRGFACVCARVCTGLRGYARVCACMWDEFSEFLLENRVPTSADFNTYPIRIFFSISALLMLISTLVRVSIIIRRYAYGPFFAKDFAITRCYFTRVLLIFTLHSEIKIF